MRRQQWMSRGLIGCLAVGSGCAAVHAETCGIDSIFAHGFEVPTPAGGIDATPGALQSPGQLSCLLFPSGRGTEGEDSGGEQGML